MSEPIRYLDIAVQSALMKDDQSEAVIALVKQYHEQCVEADMIQIARDFAVVVMQACGAIATSGEELAGAEAIRTCVRLARVFYEEVEHPTPLPGKTDPAD